jgi:hypothetical protein
MSDELMNRTGAIIGESKKLAPIKLTRYSSGTVLTRQTCVYTDGYGHQIRLSETLMCQEQHTCERVSAMKVML